MLAVVPTRGPTQIEAIPHAFRQRPARTRRRYPSPPPTSHGATGRARQAFGRTFHRPCPGPAKAHPLRRCRTRRRSPDGTFASPVPRRAPALRAERRVRCYIRPFHASPKPRVGRRAPCVARRAPGGALQPSVSCSRPPFSPHRHRDWIHDDHEGHVRLIPCLEHRDVGLELSSALAALLDGAGPWAGLRVQSWGEAACSFSVES
jgi:hypothetical protein